MGFQAFKATFKSLMICKSLWDILYNLCFLKKSPYEQAKIKSYKHFLSIFHFYSPNMTSEKSDKYF